jgi:hypothetical protein
MAGNYHGRYRYKIIYLIGRGLAFLSDRTQVGTSEKIYEDLCRKPSSTMLRSKPFSSGEHNTWAKLLGFLGGKEDVAGAHKRSQPWMGCSGCNI